MRDVLEVGPDVAVLDLSMPGLGGGEITEQIKRARPEVEVLALTAHEDRGYLQLLLKAGASGYILKRAAAEDLIRAIRTVAAGQVYLDPTWPPNSSPASSANRPEGSRCWAPS